MCPSLSPAWQPVPVIDGGSSPTLSEAGLLSSNGSNGAIQMTNGTDVQRQQIMGTRAIKEAFLQEGPGWIWKVKQDLKNPKGRRGYRRQGSQHEQSQSV